MKKPSAQLEQRRDQILEEMRALDRLRRGSLSQQFFRPPAADPSARQGPYFVLQGYFKGKKFSRRVPASQAAEVREQVDNYRRFQALAEEFVTVTEQLTVPAAADSKKN